MKYEGSKVPVEETSVRVYGVAYVILTSARLESPLNFAYVDWQTTWHDNEMI